MRPLLLALLLLFFQDQESLIGTWRLDFDRSSFASGPPAYVRLTCKISPWKGGLKVVYDMVGERGGVTHWEWTGKLDGNDYPMQGIEEVVTNAYTPVGERAYRVVAKLDGRITSTTDIAVSPDGGMMTVTSAVSNAQGRNLVNRAIYTKW